MVRTDRGLLEVREATNTSFESLCLYARSIIKLEVKSCSEASFEPSLGYGKSPCFLRCCFSVLVSIDYAVSVFASVNVGEFLELFDG